MISNCHRWLIQSRDDGRRTYWTGRPGRRECRFQFTNHGELRPTSAAMGGRGRRVPPPRDGLGTHELQVRTP